MGRLILLIILGLAVAMYFPDSRAMLAETAQPVLTPMFRWQTASATEKVVRELKTYEQEHYNQLPDRRQWPEWLEDRYGEAGALDAWGSRFHLQTTRDSFYVVSFGPDQIFGTEDDIKAGADRAGSGR